MKNEEQKIEVGTKVRISDRLRNFTINQNNLLGEEGIVEKVSIRHNCAMVLGFWFPLSSLTLVSKAETPNSEDKEVREGEKVKGITDAEHITALQEKLRLVKIQRNEIEQKYLRACRDVVEQSLRIQELEKSLQCHYESTNSPT